MKADPTGAARGARRRRAWWAPSFSISSGLHLVLLLATFAIPVVALRGDGARKLPAVASLEQRPERLIPFEPWSPPESAYEQELETIEALLVEPELLPEPLPEPLQDPVQPLEEQAPERAYPVEAGFVRRDLHPPAFKPMTPRARPTEPSPTLPEELPTPLPVEEAERVPQEELASPSSDPAVAESPGSSSDESVPELIVEQSPRPPYPILAQRMGWEGAVICRITVGANGRVAAVALERSSGHDALDRAALEGVKRWRFRPGLRGGVPAQMDVRKRVLFRLQG